jgi:uncharacterized membrane protein
MSAFIADHPFLSFLIVVVASTILFAPTFIAHLRKIRAFRSISALNALALLLAFLIIFLPDYYFVVVLLWGVTTIWSVTGRRRDA